MITQPFIPRQMQNPHFNFEHPVDGGVLHAIVFPSVVTKRPEYVDAHQTEQYWIPYQAELGISSTQKLQRSLVCAEGAPLVGDFLRVGDDVIQPLEKSASNPLICNDGNFGACGLQIKREMGREKKG